MPLDLRQNRGPIDEKDATFRDVLMDLQGNILEGHGRFHAVHLFINFNKDRIHDVKRWISKFANQQVTSAWAQVEQAVAYREHGIDAGSFGHFALSAAGYRALGLPEDRIPRGADPRNRNTPTPNAPDPAKGGYSNVFAAGMASRQQFLLDRPQKEWQTGYDDPHKPIHAMILLAADDPAEMAAVERVVASELLHDDLAKVLAAERGLNLKKSFHPADAPNGVAVEHFGYVDGRSQPLFLRRQAEQEERQTGGSFWDPRAPLGIVLVPDSNGTPGSSFGSFLVYRKLEQNVRAFRAAERKVAAELDLPLELAGALAVGRFKDGTPVVLQPGDGTRPIPNDFNYDCDPAAMSCPLHAHIRKTNPRLESVKFDGPFAKTLEEELGHRIARRGVPYGGPLSESNKPEELPSHGVGLLFFCYQADIWEQFEFIQRFWANNPLFLEPGPPDNPFDGKAQLNYPDATGIDAVIGQAIPDTTDPLIGRQGEPPRHWPAEWGKPTIQLKTDFARFVNLKGGEYLFAPSVGFLRSLATR
jgi:Dyp-type peroxidase family